MKSGECLGKDTPQQVSKTQGIPSHVKYNVVAHTKTISCHIWHFYIWYWGFFYQTDL